MERRKNDRRMTGDRRAYSYAVYTPERRIKNNRRSNVDRRN